MKKLLLPLLLITGLSATAQFADSPIQCPVMTLDTTRIYSEWSDVQITDKKLPKLPIWVYSEPYTPRIVSTPAVYCPCGCYWPVTKYQRRIDRITGIEQQRTIQQVYRVVSYPPKTEYQKLKDSLDNSITTTLIYKP